MKTTCFAAGAALCLLGATSLRAQEIALSPFATGLSNVVHVQHGGDGSGRLYLVQQQGIIRVHDGVSVRPTAFLNIDPLVQCCGEEGLLSVAFHPNYASNGFFYVYYTNNQGNNVVARYQRSADPFVANPASAFILLTISHPGAGNHNGGSMNFGPDGYLYVNTGDGGGGGDPNDNAQNLNSLLGKQLRLDVNNGTPYGIPPSNPFVGQPGRRAEIWAYGLRNPFRFSFDRQTGDIFIGDVGQGAWEEIDFQPASSPGGLNYGWDDMEGAHCFEPSTGCLTAGRVLPIIEIAHGQGDCAIIGGYRYRGAQMPTQSGRYFHSDNCSGRIRAATETSPGVWTQNYAFASNHNITTFGEDQNGELYVSATDNGIVYRLVSVPPPSISVADVSVNESAGTATVTVTLSAGVASTITVQYSLGGGTATSGTDYQPVSGTLTFLPASNTRTFTVPIVNDALDEDNETFLVTLANPINATLGDGQATVTITDDDPLPLLDVTDCAVTEGDTGLTPCGFNVVLSPVSGRSVSVSYATAGGSAVSGTDFNGVSGTLTIPAGSTSPAVAVNVVGDTAVEVDESFTLTISSPSNAALDDTVGQGTIVDDDATGLSTLELTHGSTTVADLSGGTADLFRVFQPPQSSWEVVLDAVSADAVPGLLLERLASDNSTVLQSATATGTGTALSLRWQNPLSVGVPGHHLRIRSPACGSGCGADDTYRLRVYETTLAAARFNNSSGQSSVVFLQNTTRNVVNVRVHFWSPSGALLDTYQVALPSRGTHVLLTASLAVLAGQSGSFTVAHDAPYGAIAGKAVSVDPAGFSFDTPLRSRPR